MYDGKRKVTLTSILLLVSAFFGGKKDKEDQTEEKTSTYKKGYYVVKGIAIVLGFVIGILFILLDNMSLSIAWVNQWALPIALVFLAQLFFVAIQAFAGKNNDSDLDGKDHFGQVSGEQVFS